MSTISESARESYTELVAGVRDTFDRGVTRSISWRSEQLRGLVAMLSQHEETFVKALRDDLGRPEAEAYGADIGVSKLHIRYLLKNLGRWSRPRASFPGLLSMPGWARRQPEPLGVALIISPWNYPIQLLVEPLAAALAAGNAAVCKPSELSPASTAALAQLLPRYVDDDAVAVVEGGVPETTALLEIPFDHIFFTGSTNVGRVVMTAAAKHLTPVTLELGGKSPTIVAADADIDVAAKRIVWGKFMNASQTCIAPDYILADSRIRDRLVDRMTDVLHDFYGTNPAESDSFGRVVNERHHGRLAEMLSTGGGTVVVGGEHDVSTRYFAPTIVVDPEVDSALMTEEIFGPILPVISVDDVDEAIAFVNGRPKPLALYVFSSASATAQRVLDRTSSGGACVNHCVVHILPDNLPFGGVGPSGMGAYHGKAGFDVFSHYKSIMSKPTWIDPPILYPPYTDQMTKLLKRVFR